MNFRVMQRISGDERAISEHVTYDQAAVALEAYAKAACVCSETLPTIRAELSIWEVGGRIVGVIDPATNALKRAQSFDV